MNEFLLVMAVFLFITIYLVSKMVGQQNSAIPTAEANVTKKIADDMN